ncbi:hypothetical protein HDV64DRAFT_287527 [Trichoderma sp. TUCIM 5745]
MANSLTGNRQTLASDEGSVYRPKPKIKISFLKSNPASTTELKDSSTHCEDTEAMELDGPTATPQKAESKDGNLGSLEITKLEDTKEDDTQEELIMKLFDMVRDVTAEQLALKQLQITNTICRLKELQDQQPPKITFNPTMANSCRERLEGTLAYLTSELSAIPAAKWTIYRKKLLRFCESESILAMTFAQRLYKVVDIIYLPEEMDAIPQEDFERMHSVARICVAAAQALGPESESEEILAEKWISAKAQDLEFLRKMFRSMRGIFKASAPERTEMPWETQGQA